MQTPEISLSELREDHNRLRRMTQTLRLVVIQLGEELDRTGAKLDAAEVRLAQAAASALHNKNITALKVAS